MQYILPYPKIGKKIRNVRKKSESSKKIRIKTFYKILLHFITIFQNGGSKFAFFYYVIYVPPLTQTPPKTVAYFSILLSQDSIRNHKITKIQLTTN